MIFLKVAVTTLTVSVVMSLETASSDMVASGGPVGVEDKLDLHKYDGRSVFNYCCSIFHTSGSSCVWARVGKLVFSFHCVVVAVSIFMCW